ncbi:bromodomain-containing protein 1 [Contarinia nasturtii]|uniref:bromodomain-containing protein 1 n=1 Tax=Contarinia nasturtii TaxID=265458 RepID=UPI0012D472C1|nr:bromodomain-containing protein 1 [Contarinia nasturtii]
MGLDFDPIDYCRTLARAPSPYKCPVEKCNKSYKSIYGLQYHLVNYDHDTRQQITPVRTPARKQKTSPVAATAGGGGLANFGSPKEGLTYLEAQHVVQFEIDGKSIKVSTLDPIPMIEAEDYEKLVEKGEAPTFVEPEPEPHLKLPEANYKKVENYSICDAPQRPNAYIRFIEKSPEELDGEIEYDVDEEDAIWLERMNNERAETGLTAVPMYTLEVLMDRLEKESYFQTTNDQGGAVVDADAVCCICLDGDATNTNFILFCDRCNLAVHQDCYGVPYIPEGQWLCRRCLQSPSRPVDCVLCPNTGGAFKQTDRNQWAHVVCALWIPEVRFANTVFLEPIDSIETIPPARWRLTCYICKQKMGACIQCQRNSCYAAFHVTCAQQAGLYMHMDTVKSVSDESSPVTVQKSAYCDAHCPAVTGGNDSISLSSAEAERLRQQSRIKMKQARKTLAMKRESVPLILIPTIPPDRVQHITSLVHFHKKAAFIQRLIAYWTLKRQHRNGVPLLRRLQSQGQMHQNRGIEGSPNASELNQQLKYWQCLRQDLERARLLCELVRKREKLKAHYIRVAEQSIMMQLNPLEEAMSRLLDNIFLKDVQEIFTEPVDIEEVPDYTLVVTHPMDLSTMRSKLRDGKYDTLDDMENDFNLMIQNCLAYNNKDTIFYRAGIRMRDQCGPVFKAVRKELIREGIVEKPQSDESIAHEVDTELVALLEKDLPYEELIPKLQELMEKSLRIKHGLVRQKRVKNVKAEIMRAKKLSSRGEKSNPNSPTKVTPKKRPRSPANTSQSDDLDDTNKESLAQPVTPSCSPIKNASNSASPSGVNRRTAVLFTRKAKAAASIKKPETTTGRNSLATDSTSSTPTLSVFDNKLTSPSTSSLAVPSTSASASIGMSCCQKKVSPTKERYVPSSVMPDSFRTYRGRGMAQSSDSEDSNISHMHSCECSSCSGSEFGSSYDDEDDDFFSGSDDREGEEREKGNLIKSFGTPSTEVSPSKKKSDESSSGGTSNNTSSESASSTNANPSTSSDAEYEPLQLVWAKCRGYPWYPALIIDPTIPKGFIYNGVPLPTPPKDVLGLRKDKVEPVYLVLFFDAKRTWQWLPPNKLERLGISDQIDKSKLTESRKQSKAVRKAYDDALHYNSQVTDLNGQGPGAIA